MEWLCVPPPTNVEGVLSEMRKLVKESDVIVKSFDSEAGISWRLRWRIGRMRNRFESLRKTKRRFMLGADEEQRYISTVSEFKSAQACIDMLTGDFNEAEQSLFVDE